MSFTLLGQSDNVPEVEEEKNSDIICRKFMIMKVFDKCDNKYRHKVTDKLAHKINKFLINRPQRMIVNHPKSTTSIRKRSVPKGTVLVPLLFLILVSEIDTDIVTYHYLQGTFEFVWRYRH